MPKKLYFAHCMADYSCARERRALAVIEANFPDESILNPNTPDVQVRYRRGTDPMAWFRRLVREKCGSLVYLVNADGVSISSGVAVEALEALAWGYPVWALVLPSTSGSLLYPVLNIPHRILSIAETRSLIRRTS